MTLSEAERAMASIEGLDATLDPDKAEVYISLAKEFVARAGRYCDMHGLPRVTPFIDPMSEFQERLPEHLERRLSAWEEGPRGLNPFVLMACRLYLRYLAGRESLPPEQRDEADIYAPLFQLLMQGGDFYMHHGDLCVTDVGMIILIGR